MRDLRGIRGESSRSEVRSWSGERSRSGELPNVLSLVASSARRIAEGSLIVTDFVVLELLAAATFAFARRRVDVFWPEADDA